MPFSEKGYILRGIVPHFRIGDSGSHEVRKYINGGFVVAHYFNLGDMNSGGFFQARDKAEKVG